MTETPNDDKSGFATEKPEHCHACSQLIRPGQIYFLTIGNAVLCGDCIKATDAIRVVDELVVVIEGGKLLVQRGSAAGEVSPGEVRHLVDALVEGTEKLVGRQTH